ncbi:expressed unknown protein [Seminavis robusta]|uniref:SHSP domain-containing protein n=1 Tax=Seminavis robusta TaxID=568900 RepID=A0A9N8HXL1_9STRA|nr:expressed unknown protein [Seminavis robusta]|eukprot:Sro2500_g329410.1 n/a (173) ;mRNA; f:3833-4351
MDEDANLTATLEEGILTVKVPVKKEKDEAKGGNKAATTSHEVMVSKQPPPSLDNDVELNLEVDVPGIRPNDLNVVCDKKNGILHVAGESHQARGPSRKTKTSYRLNARTVDLTKLEAYLTGGVLTIRALRKAHPIKIVVVNGHFPAIASDDALQRKEKGTEIVEQQAPPKDE